MAVPCISAHSLSESSGTWGPLRISYGSLRCESSKPAAPTSSSDKGQLYLTVPIVVQGCLCPHTHKGQASSRQYYLASGDMHLSLRQVLAGTKQILRAVLCAEGESMSLGDFWGWVQEGDTG